MTEASFALFDTPIGSCGIAWSDSGIVAVQLPEADTRATRARMLRMRPGAQEASPPPSVRKAITAISGLLSGDPTRLDSIVLDMQDVPPFHRRVYEAAREIPPGGTLTYGAIAVGIGSPGSARAVGQALGRNPFAIVVPCHRVVAANGKLGGFSANGGVTTKTLLLSLETAAPSVGRSTEAMTTTSSTKPSAAKKTAAPKNPGTAARKTVAAARATTAGKTATAKTSARKAGAATTKAGAATTKAGAEKKASATAAGSATTAAGSGAKTAGSAGKTAGSAAKTAGSAGKTAGTAAKTAGSGAKAAGTAAKTAGTAAKTAESAANAAATERGATPAGKAGEYGFSPKTALAHLRKADPKLGRFIDSAGPFDLIINPADTVFGMLAEAIIYQQLTAKAASTIFGRVCEAIAGGKRPRPKDVLAASEADLRGAGLSNAKARALLDLAEKAESGELPTLAKIKQLPDDEIIETLVKVRGVGRWTAEMFLIFRLGRPDVLPLDDYGLRRGYSLVFGAKELPSKAELEKAGEKWAPYRTAASWYLWKAAEPPLQD